MADQPKPHMPPAPGEYQTRMKKLKAFQFNPIPKDDIFQRFDLWPQFAIDILVGGRGLQRTRAGGLLWHGRFVNPSEWLIEFDDGACNLVAPETFSTMYEPIVKLPSKESKE